MSSEKILSSRTIFEGRVVKLSTNTVEKSTGETVSREIVEHRDCIAAVVLDDRDNVIMVRQCRTPTGKDLLEIPAGVIEEGESPEECVGRELQEEIGYRPEKVVRLAGFYSAPGYCTEFIYAFLATGLKESRIIAEDTDEIEVVRVPIAKIAGMIDSGEICDAKSVAGLLKYLSMLP
ncbi:MAG: NUDIX hydrolase [Chloroflexi bacterium]|jgi:ADP-ribose pyrophosphatase|nr:NUDIX hydrolase [Chloroflexota bacterium]